MRKNKLFQKNSKAQVSMEFVFLVGLAFTVMVVFISSTRSEFDDLRGEEERSLLKDVSVMVQHELIIASNVENGYFRIFKTPYTLNGVSYSLSVNDGILLATTEDYESVMNVPIVVGDIQIGENSVNKTGGVIYLN